MRMGRLLKAGIKYAPIAYPIIRKALQKRKNSSTARNTDTSEYRTTRRK